MDDVVAVRVELGDGTARYFLTWGRIQDEVDPVPLENLVLQHAITFSLGGEPVTARVCRTLREAATSESAPYFYECFRAFLATPIPHGDSYAAWRAERADAMSNGREISYCGDP